VRNHSPLSLCRPLAGLVSTLLIALAPVACRKEAGPPSEAYEQARARFSKLYAQKLDQAFLEPEMDEIEELLTQVPPDSIDAQSARELQQRIREGRERMEAVQQETEDAIAAARQVDDYPSTGSSPPTPEQAPPQAAPAEVGQQDAGASAGPVPGTPASELSGGFQGCFRRGQPVTITGAGSGPRETWEMQGRVACELAYPSFIGQLLVIEEGRVLAVLPKSAVRVTYVGPDGGVVPDAGR
jgi:hypothetical protein